MKCVQISHTKCVESHGDKFFQKVMQSANPPAGKILQLVKNRLSSFKGADVSENLLQYLAGIFAVLSHPVTAVGIRTDGNNLASQLLEPPEIIRGGKEAAAPVQAAGVQFQALSLGGQNAQNFVDDFPVVFIGQGGLYRASGSLVQLGHVGQYVKILVDPDAFQHGFEIMPLGFPNGFSLPVFREIHIDVVYEMDGAQDKIITSGV